ncbi:PAS domain-containing sensor histidine kinase [Bacteriovorax sp. Seq25_V]|uniref:sensor histidine kinase n=1 Tax=Bacteriovorax sp. Seq25_V TaxID=1201288 RepID=UPI000389E6A8|nr:PAS domain-containing sensor histidine kinase [Bacteriovorax sp. Seq25_V]EQC47403.1 PAS domain S-box protein [Bacteriovorax sp. Seq25_V]
MNTNKIKKFLETSNDAVLIFNKEFEIFYVNSAMLKSLSVSEEEYKRIGFMSFTHPDDQVRLKVILEKVFTNPKIHVKERIRAISRTGIISHYEWSAYYDDKEDVIFAQGRILETHNSSDVQIYGEAKKLAQIGVWEYHVEANYVKWDDEVYKIYELSTSTAMTLDRMQQFFRKESLDIFKQKLKDLIENTIPFDEELSFISGQFRPSTARFMAKLSRGKETVVIGTIQDLTMTRKIERTAADYREAVDKSSIVSITDRYGVITEVNDKFCQISKYSREELIGKSHNILKSDFHSNEFWKEMWETITRGDVWHGQIKNKAKNGSFFWVDTTVIPFKNSIGRIYQYLAIQRDFTENKRLNEELMVSEKLSSIGEISAQILHEVMTPLSIISLSIENLEDEIDELQLQGAKSLPIKTNLTEIKMNYEKIEEIFENMRSILVRKNQGESINVNIKTTIAKTLSLVNAKMKSRNIAVNYQAVNEKLNIFCTETDLSQIFLNLLNNAADAIEKLEDKWIEIKASADNSMIKIEFQDSGKGIPEEIRANIFETLFTTKGENRGTGLGMGVVKKLVERHLGKIYIDAEADHTTFVLTFPFQAK